MAISALTPRDRLQRLVDLGRKTLRYWWLIALFAVVGGALSLAFAMMRTKKYQSWATIFYQERIQSQLLSPNREEIVQRNIGDKYRELLLARAQLALIVSDPALNPFPEEDDPDTAIDKLRETIKLEARGGNAFRIVYTDVDRERARGVTEKLTKLLQEKDEGLRNEQARETVRFATKEREDAEKELRTRAEALTKFLSEHQEFASDPNSAQSEGASIRARTKEKDTKELSPEMKRLEALQRQRTRLQRLLDAPPGTTPAPIPMPASPARNAADARLAEAKRELSSSTAALEDAQGKYGPKHPTVISAQSRVQQAQQRVRDAEGAVPNEPEAVVVPATPEARKRVEQQRADIDQQIAKLRDAKPGAPANDITAQIVNLEVTHEELRRRFNFQREQVNKASEAESRSETDARQKLAETGGRLSLIDPAFKPVKPSGPAKKVFLMAGMVVFLSLGLGLAVLLAVIDDRLYRRSDLDQLGMAVLAVIPPGPRPLRRVKQDTGVL